MIYYLSIFLSFFFFLFLSLSLVIQVRDLKQILSMPSNESYDQLFIPCNLQQVFLAQHTHKCITSHMFRGVHIGQYILQILQCSCKLCVVVDIVICLGCIIHSTTYVQGWTQRMPGVPGISTAPNIVIYSTTSF